MVILYKLLPELIFNKTILKGQFSSQDSGRVVR